MNFKIKIAFASELRDKQDGKFRYGPHKSSAIYYLMMYRKGSLNDISKLWRMHTNAPNSFIAKEASLIYWSTWKQIPINEQQIVCNWMLFICDL